MPTYIPYSPIVSLSAWLGIEQSNRSDWIYMLSAAEKADLDSAIRVYRVASKPLTEIVAPNYSLPALGPAIERWMRELDDGRGFVLVRGFPSGDYSEEEAAFAYWLIGLHMGVPVPPEPQRGSSWPRSRRRCRHHWFALSAKSQVRLPQSCRSAACLVGRQWPATRGGGKIWHGEINILPHLWRPNPSTRAAWATVQPCTIGKAITRIKNLRTVARRVAIDGQKVS
jgi:hypothetical protein